MKAVPSTTVQMLMEESQHPDVVQGYAFAVKNFYFGCQYAAERLLNVVCMEFDLFKFKYELIKTYMWWLEENHLENNERSARLFVYEFRKEVSKRMFNKFRE